jgi:hypothetical protein
MEIVMLAIAEALLIFGILYAGFVWVLEEHQVGQEYTWVMVVVGVGAIIAAYGLQHGSAAFLELLAYSAAAGAPMIVACSVHHVLQERRDTHRSERTAREALDERQA